MKTHQLLLRDQGNTLMAKKRPRIHTICYEEPSKHTNDCY
jgi:hypothetical protein